MKRGWIVGVIVLVVVCGGGGFALQRLPQMMSARNQPKVKPVTVERGEVAVRVIESGSLQPIKTVEVKSRVSGRVARLLVDEGDYVKAGDLVAVIDPQETELQVQQNAAQVRGAEAAVRRTDVDLAQRRVTAANALARAQSQLRQVEKELSAQPTLTNAAVTSARSALAQALQARQQLVEVTQPNARIAAQTGVRDAEVSLENAERERARLESLLEKGYIARRELESAGVQVQLAQSRLATARETLARQDASQRLEREQADERIRQAEADLKRAEANTITDDVKREQYIQAQRAVSDARAQLRDVDGLLASRAQQTAQVQQLRTVLQDGQRQLGETRIVAPISGVVTRRFVQIGELVASLNSFSAGSPIFRIEDRTRLLVKLDINEIDVAKLALGMGARVNVDAFANDTFAGKVTKIAPTSTSAASAAGAAGGADQVVKYAVEVTLNNASDKLKSGMSAKCTMDVVRRDNVLRVPLDYVGRDDKGTFVMVAATEKEALANDAKGTRVEVKLGAESGTFYEITSGVKGGEFLVKPPFTGPKRSGMMQFGPDDEEAPAEGESGGSQSSSQSDGQ
jgi:HlyD family secretion protein